MTDSDLVFPVITFATGKRVVRVTASDDRENFTTWDRRCLNQYDSLSIVDSTGMAYEVAAMGVSDAKGFAERLKRLFRPKRRIRFSLSDPKQSSLAGLRERIYKEFRADREHRLGFEWLRFKEFHTMLEGTDTFTGVINFFREPPVVDWTLLPDIMEHATRTVPIHWVRGKSTGKITYYVPLGGKWWRIIDTGKLHPKARNGGLTETSVGGKGKKPRLRGVSLEHDNITDDGVDQEEVTRALGLAGRPRGPGPIVVGAGGLLTCAGALMLFGWGVVRWGPLGLVFLLSGCSILTWEAASLPQQLRAAKRGLGAIRSNSCGDKW